MINISELRPILKMPAAIIPAALVTASVLSVYLHLNLDKFRRSVTRIREVLEYEATQKDSVFGGYRASRDTAYKMDRLGWPLNYNAFLAVNTALALFFAPVSIMLLDNPYLAAAAPVIWMLFCHQLVGALYRTRVKAKIDSQAQLMLQLLAEVYSVSNNLPQAIERVIPSTPQPLRGSLEKLVLQVKTNGDLNRCLIEFAANIDNRDIETFVHGIILSDQFGSDTHEVIAKNAEVIRDRISLREELVSETRGKKAIILIFMVFLPVAFLWLLLGSDQAREAFTGTTRGKYLVTALVIVEYLCWYFESRREVAEDL